MRPGRLVLSVVVAWSSNAGSACAQRVIDVFLRLPLGRDHVYSVNINASQVLFAGGGVRAGIRLARREREVGRAGELAGALDGGGST